MLIHSTRFGEIEVSEDSKIHFLHGLPGFPQEKEFAYLPSDAESPFAFLQSLVEPRLTFIVVDPFVFFKDYVFTLSEQITSELELSDANPPQIISIVSIPAKPEEMTANLLAPVIINTKKRIAIQTVLEKTTYTTRHRLFPHGFGKQPDKGGK